ncbi:MAG TPA: hypothetical protein VH332_00605 [Nitrospira sp.]
MKALLLLVEVRRSAHSLAIWLNQSFSNVGEPALPPSKDRPASAGRPLKSLSPALFFMVPLRCRIYHPIDAVTQHQLSYFVFSI